MFTVLTVPKNSFLFQNKIVGSRVGRRRESRINCSYALYCSLLLVVVSMSSLSIIVVFSMS
jgi:hypothetical protein